MHSNERRTWLAVALAAAAISGCTKTAPDTATVEVPATEDACKGAPDLGWVGRVAEDKSLLEGGGGGWIAFYQRKYREAATQLGSVPDDPIAQAGRARAHLRLGMLHLSLARLLARAQADYFEERGKLGDGTSALPAGPYFHGVALYLAGKPLAGQAILSQVAAGQTGSPAIYRALARAWPKDCKPEVTARSAWDQVAAMARCASEGLPPCPDKTGAPPEGDWKTRVAVYHAALCAEPGTVDEARLRELVQTPAAIDTVKGKGSVKAELEHFDPLAMWALGQLNLRLAENLSKGSDPASTLVRAWAQATRGDKTGAEASLASLEGKPLNDVAPDFLLLSDWRDAAALQAHVKAQLTSAASPGGEPEAALARMRATQAEDTAGVDCVGTADGQKIAKDLGLASGFARTALRQRALPWLNTPQSCANGLRVLRATQDIKNLESMSYANEPAFLVSLAEAALCMRRSAEAIGALRTVRDAYPEAAGALSAAQGLSVVRLMGGTGGTQKIQ